VIVMADKKQPEKIEPVVPMLRNEIISIVVLGGLVGLFLWGMGLVLDRFVFDAYLCQNETSNQCAYAKNYAAITAGIIGGVLALVGLIRLRVYRPLLVLLATVISLWGVVQLGWKLDWYVGALIAMLMYAVAFATFSWIARVRAFWIALSVTVVLVIAVRLAVAL
jgi:hypothetical protein